MLPSHFLEKLRADDISYKNTDISSFLLPEYDAKTHYLELTRSEYYRALIMLRHYIKAASDYYFSQQGAKNIDLFMLTPSVSSPMGPGSDSEAISIQFGDFSTNLVDSSQFGFEPLLLNGTDRLYCYLPSMRGENPDKRHLNQFFHCEAEVKGDISVLTPIIEGYIRILAETLLAMPHVLERLSLDFEKTKLGLERVVSSSDFPEITFDEAVDALMKNGKESFVRFTDFGRDISSDGELAVAAILKFDRPFWIRNYDRDRVAFYQKPDPRNTDRVVNADLIFPPMIGGAFGGEIVGCGQRQDNPTEMLESLRRQKISPELYEWYIELRRLPDYSTTSGFGLGIERFIAWSLCRDDIKTVIPYPRLKNVLTLP